MMAQIANLEFILAETELEALILESNLVKERQPKYNVILKDDKHYPFLRLDVTDPFPMVTVARRILDLSMVRYIETSGESTCRGP
jgi:excinuclease ABC subunit C